MSATAAELLAMPGVAPLADLIRDRRSARDEVLWGLLMRCHDCGHRIADHDEVAARCLECSCAQGGPGWIISAYADRRLTLYGRALRVIELEETE